MFVSTLQIESVKPYSVDIVKPKLSWFCIQANFCFHAGGLKPAICLLFSRLNGSLPNNVEIKNNTLFFKGPVTYELGGTYVCDATNSIGTRSGMVEVNVTGESRGLCSA